MKNLNFINGWSLKVIRVSCVLAMVVMVMFNQRVFAEDEPEASIEFLEFLGNGVTVEQEFLDPMNYKEIDSDSLSDNKQDTDQKNRQNDDE